MKFYQLKAGNIVSIVGSGQRPEGNSKCYTRYSFTQSIYQACAYYLVNKMTEIEVSSFLYFKESPIHVHKAVGHKLQY